MPKSNLFLLLPETNTTNQWMLSNAPFQNEEGLTRIVREIKIIQDALKIENYSGFYDLQNVKNFLEYYSVIQDFYPFPYFRRIRSILSNWENWRENKLQSSKRNYLLFSQFIMDNTFCEIAERKFINVRDSYALINHYASSINKNVKIQFSSWFEIEIDIIRGGENVTIWMSKNRLPERIFHKNPKHGENGKGNYSNASPLMCSSKQAKILLENAIGLSERELFNYDQSCDMVIVFKQENSSLTNAYHAYHISKDSYEIPNKILNILFKMD